MGGVTEGESLNKSSIPVADLVLFTLVDELAFSTVDASPAAASILKVNVTGENDFTITYEISSKPRGVKGKKHTLEPSP